MTKYILYAYLFLSITIFAQTDYTMKLTNPVQLSNNSLEFDLTIQSNSSDFSLTSYQCSFSFDLILSLNDSISLTYVENSSDLSNFPLNIVGHDSLDGLNEIIFVSGIGNDLISTEEQLVGKFYINSSIDFSIEDLNLQWNFLGNANTILTGENFINITDSTRHFNFDGTITDIESENIIPEKFYISQNYPNPFNPTTKIDFSLPKGGLVKITIFNILGEVVSTPIDKLFSTGKHTIEIDGRLLASGTYFYSIEMGKYKTIKKMILLK